MSPRLPVAAVAAAAAVGMAAIPAVLAARPGDTLLADMGARQVAWARSCTHLSVGRLDGHSAVRLPGAGETCDLVADGIGTLYATDLRRGGRLEAITASGSRLLSPAGAALRTPVSPSPAGGSVAYCADLPSGRPNTPRMVVYVATAVGGVKRVGRGCLPAWTPAGLVYVSRFQRVFSEFFGVQLRVWRPGRAGRVLPLPAHTMLADVTAVPGADSVGVVSVYPDVQETLTLYPVRPRGRPWRVCRAVGGQVMASAPVQGQRFTVAVSTWTGVIRLYLADAAHRTLRALGRMPPGRALWSPDGTVLAWASATGSWKVFDPRSGRLLTTAPARGLFAALL
jgi:hypothetical protein